MYSYNESSSNVSSSKAKQGSSETPTLTLRLITGFLNIHKHRYFRRLFCGFIILHILILLFPFTEKYIEVPQSATAVLKWCADLWPFPTFKMSSVFSNTTQILLTNLLYKAFEISIMLLYTVDLLPKIFYWRKPLLWKSINAIIVSLMVIQVPFTLRGYLEANEGGQILKIRLCSIGLSFLLLCEIMTIREQRTLKQRLLLNETKPQDNSSSSSNKKTAKDLKDTEDTAGFLKYLIAKAKEDSTYKKYTWAEIIKHDRPDDCWIVVHGKVYDVTRFLPTHPGGKMILDGAGGDCTSMFESYHPLYLTKSGVPNEFLIGEVRDYESFYSWDGTFYRTVKERVEKLLPPNKRRYHWILFVKAIVIIIADFIALYYYITVPSYTTALIYGLLCSQVGVNIMHDGNHGAFTDNKHISWLAGVTLDMLGGPSVVYRRSHNFGHHGCVNHFELDRSFDTTYPTFRMSNLQKKHPFHRYQHIYMWWVYSFVNFADLFGTFDELYWMSNFPARRGYVSKKVFITHSLVKLMWCSQSLIIPSYLHGWYTVFPLWFSYLSIFSIGYSWFFAVNHWTEEAGQVDNTSISKTNWGVLQVENSTNFAIHSPLWTNLSGGLNYQIEHHLFPAYCHTRYPEITHVVQKTCKEYGIRYFTFNSFWGALWSHYKLLRKFAYKD